MADASYDAVIIGSGHNALITGCYLAYSGLSVAVFEGGDEIGGGTQSDETFIPGFICEPFALITRLWSHPVYTDFKLAEKGLDWVFSKASRGAIFLDGTCIVNYPAVVVVDKMTGRTEYYKENAEKTFNSIARISEKDAETARLLDEKIRTKWRPALAEVTFSPPKPWGKKDAVERLMDDPDSGFEPIYSVMTLEQMAHELWESPKMQSLFMRRAQVPTGLWPGDVPGPVYMAMIAGVCLPGVIDSLPVGGMRALPHVLQRAFSEMGGKVFVRHEVDKVLVEGGAAKGIRLRDGAEIKAKKMVISGVDAEQTVLRFLGDDYVSPKIARRVRNILHDRGQFLWGWVALHEPPRYKAEDYDPDCTLLFGKYLLPNDADYMTSKYEAEARIYGLPKNLLMAIYEVSPLDKSRAPEGKYLGGVEIVAGPIRSLSEKGWLKLKDKLSKEIIRQWQSYATNINKDNLIDCYIYTPFEMAKRDISMGGGEPYMGDGVASQMGRFRPIPELSGYRMPVKNMYLASSAASGFGGVKGASGYICYKVIAEDFGLRKIWEEKGRSY
jgi:beta-carotene ketolase (CrtO type)